MYTHNSENDFLKSNSFILNKITNIFCFINFMLKKWMNFKTFLRIILRKGCFFARRDAKAQSFLLLAVDVNAYFIHRFVIPRNEES